MEGAVGDIDTHALSSRRDYRSFRHLACTIEHDHTEPALQCHDGFVLVGIEVTMRSDIGVRFQRIEQAMCRRAIVEVEIAVLAPARTRCRFEAERGKHGSGDQHGGTPRT